MPKTALHRTVLLKKAFVVTIILSPVADHRLMLRHATAMNFLHYRLVIAIIPNKGGIGNSIAAGTTIETTQVIYVFATTETTPACINEKSLTVRITPNLVHQQTRLNRILYK